MKILRVINSLNIGGAERSVVGNVPLHIQNGFDVDLLLLNGKKTHFYEELLQKNIKVVSLGVNNNIYNPLMILKIAKLINKYDIVHVSLFPALYWVAFAKIFTGCKVKLIFTEHSTNNRRRGNLLLTIIDKLVYKQYDKIVAISPEANQNLSLHLKNQITITTIYNGVDITKVFNESKDSSDFNGLEENLKNKKIIIQVASFRHQKDQDTVIKAMPYIDQGTHLLLVGAGPRIKLCQDLAIELQVSNRISFLGIQKNVHALYGIADIVIMSSHYEGFGRAAVEGMAARKPVIASDVAGLSEVVKNHGILFEPGNHLDLAKIINELLTDNVRYEEVANKSLKRAQEFDIKHMISAYEIVYREVYN